ncbi:MAG: mannose-1-phosphate guanylyltransferase [Gemmatimonadetes bacterium]|nr:mannose-1-phosphate guanylyltransferase [Gemmatimonadota bacterium]
MKFVIRAGGIGSRLWPYSRQSQPKQFHAFEGDMTMLQHAYHRVVTIASGEDRYVSTGAAHDSLVREQLPELGDDHVIIEPALRNTGPAVGLECVLLEHHAPGCTIASLGSDHHIGKPEEFCRLLLAAEEALIEHPDTLILVGVKPWCAETAYGYIQKGGVIHEANDEPIYAVEAFKEKPDVETAQVWFESGNYLWNSNMFVWRADTLLRLFERFEPEIYEGLMTIKASLGTDDADRVLSEVYPTLKEIPVDNAILEKAEKVAVVEADIDWSDIGSWGAMSDVLPTDSDDNLLNGNVISIDAKNTTVYSQTDKLIALVGVDNLAIVETEDALLILPRDESQRVRDLVDKLSDGYK